MIDEAGMRVRGRGLLPALLLAALALPAAAAPVSRSTTQLWFDADGRVTASGSEWAAARGLPALQSGEPVHRLEIGRVTNRYAAEKAQCASVQFRIGPDGRTDQFLVLESVPRQSYGVEVARAVAQWQFVPTGQAQTGIVSIDFDDGDTATGTRLRNQQACLEPSVRAVDLVAGERQPLATPMPYFPPEQVAGREAGCVTVGFKIRPDGLADGYQLIDAQPPKAFVATSLQALNDWRFSPGATESEGQARIAFGYLGDDRSRDCAPPTLARATAGESSAPR